MVNHCRWEHPALFSPPGYASAENTAEKIKPNKSISDLAILSDAEKQALNQEMSRQAAYFEEVIEESFVSDARSKYYVFVLGFVCVFLFFAQKG